MRDSTHKAERSAIGDSKVRPAAMKVERLMRCEEGEYEAAVTPERRVLRQNVVGRTVHGLIFVYGLECRNETRTKWRWWANELPCFESRRI